MEKQENLKACSTPKQKLMTWYLYLIKYKLCCSCDMAAIHNQLLKPHLQLHVWDNHLSAMQDYPGESSRFLLVCCTRTENRTFKLTHKIDHHTCQLGCVGGHGEDGGPSQHSKSLMGQWAKGFHLSYAFVIQNPMKGGIRRSACQKVIWKYIIHMSE